MMISLPQILIIFLIFIILAAAFLSIMAWSARKTLYKGGIAWSAKQLPIIRNRKRKDSSLLNEIAMQSSEFLKEQEKET